MQGINTAERGHWVNLLPPVDISGGKTGDRFSMKNYGHASILVQIGVSAAAFTKIELYACTAPEGGETPIKLPYNVYKQEVAAGDVLGPRTPVDANGVSPSANDNIFYVIELDARELPEGYPWVELKLTNGVNSVIASAAAWLSGARYANDQSETVLA